MAKAGWEWLQEHLWHWGARTRPRQLGLWSLTLAKEPKRTSSGGR